MRALSIRQPFAELILRGIKTVEYRSRVCRLIGERFWIYASVTPVDGRWLKSEIRNPKSEANSKSKTRIVGENIAVPEAPLPLWMQEIAEQLKIIPEGTELPRGVIVGSARIERCERVEDRGWRVDLNSNLHPLPSLFRWHLTDVERATTLRKPKNHPQPVWFRPF